MDNAKVTITRKWGHLYLRPWRWLVMLDVEERDEVVYYNVRSGSTFTFNGAVKRSEQALEELIMENETDE